MFKRNMSTLDRIIRIVAGVILLYLGFISPEIIGIHSKVLGTVLGVFGLINIGSAFMGHCPAYNVAGISTCKDCDTNTDKE